MKLYSQTRPLVLPNAPNPELLEMLAWMELEESPAVDVADRQFQYELFETRLELEEAGIELPEHEVLALAANYYRSAMFADRHTNNVGWVQFPSRFVRLAA